MMFPVKSIKLRMQDHTSHYINLPLMELAEDKLGISNIPGVTPNLISGTHLFCAIVAAKCMTSGQLGMRRFGVALYELRYQLDILDGVVYRAQANKRNSYASGFGSIGYLVDAFTDFCGGILLALSCALFLSRYPPLKRVKTRIYGDQELGRKSSLMYGEGEVDKFVHLSRRTVMVKMFLVTLQIVLRSALWDYFLRNYHDLLERRNPQIPQFMQEEVLDYRSTWLVMWFWKLSSADAALQFTLLAVLFDKLWMWVQLLNYIGWIQLVIVALISQMHLMEVREYLLGV
ncbi:predicted protein [Nematostella vectensis]|uniref:Ceramide phosphoethanolamine synthase n=2 Tax=Nematostella vectensis TaxID=45351 RepID=A7S4T3_NEMVE|nr:predicted protein [Nematostella vectensis]|eukprot:XP_001633270.1 predicted protein [Nematostella vectensis]